jgi:hypothetical protein
MEKHGHHISCEASNVLLKIEMEWFCWMMYFCITSFSSDNKNSSFWKIDVISKKIAGTFQSGDMKRISDVFGKE